MKYFLLHFLFSSKTSSFVVIILLSTDKIPKYTCCKVCISQATTGSDCYKGYVLTFLFLANFLKPFVHNLESMKKIFSNFIKFHI